MNERSIFMAALEGETPAARSAYLDEACGGDAALRERVEALLASHEQAGSFLDKPVPERLAGRPEETRAAAPVAEGLGSRIGPYKLLQEIGEGGMGTVWMAQQTEPVKRLVALKVIKPGMDSKQVLARFEAERQALALMDHPNIARVLDAATTETGRPYFVMELVKGVSITRYCDEHRLTPRERLELFIPVCQALQHAHQKGVIHRDVKPSNVLVCLYDGRPVPKVIDFGIAKATGQQLTEKTLATGFGSVVGTLEYMSPEQAELNQLDIDTRSDVYSLGVLLYELLTGSTPLEKKRLKQVAMLEILRLIREEEPPRPSTRLSESKDSLPSISAQRHTEPAKLTKLVRGELDWIVMKALEKNRTRRYETADGFALDVRRYLADEPVLACPPSASYRLRKFARRYKTALAVTGLVLFFIALLGGGAGWVMRDRAARQAQAANDLGLALDRAEQFQGQGNRAEALAALERTELLAGQAPADADRDERLATLKERLAADGRDQVFTARYEDIRLRAQSHLKVDENRFAQKASLPEIQEALHQYGIDIGVLPTAEAAARIQGRPEAIRRNLVAALEECLRRAPEENAQTRQWLRDTLDAADTEDGAEAAAWRVRVRQAWAERGWTTVEELARAVDVRRQPPSFLLFVADSLPPKMQAARVELLRRIQRAYTADLWANLGLARELTRNGQPGEAVRYYTAALALRPDNPGIYFGRGYALRAAGELDAAIVDCRQAVALAPQYADAHYNLGNALQAKGDLKEAVTEYRAAIVLKPDDAEAHCNLGNALRDKGELKEAITAYRAAIALKPDYAEAHYNLGNALRDKGELGEAITEYRTAIALEPNLTEAHYNLGHSLQAKGELGEAITEYRAAIVLKPDYVKAHYNLGNALRDKGEADEAIAAYREAIRFQADHAEARCNLGLLLAQQGEIRQGLEELRRGDELGQVRGPHWRYPSAQWVRQLERLVELDERLPGFLDGQSTPASPAERLELADLCFRKRLYAAAARFAADAFAAQPNLAEDLGAGHRYRAARAAALAGCGQGKDADQLDDQGKARWRRQALRWLQANLALWAKRLDSGKPADQAVVAAALGYWQSTAALAGVRDRAALATLPDTEQQPWQKFWDDVASLLARAQAKTTPEKKPVAK